MHILGGEEVITVSNASLRSLPDIEEQQTIERVHYLIIDVLSGPMSAGNVVCVAKIRISETFWSPR